MVDSDKHIIELNNITKQFSRVKALDDVSLYISKGSIHGLVGENGAGKTTLTAIISGSIIPTQGTVTYKGRVVYFGSPHEAATMGISVVHQEYALAEPLSVLENIFMGNLMIHKDGTINWHAMRDKARCLIAEIGVEIDVDEPVSNLSVAGKQVVEILRAVCSDAEIIIMDEPSAVLTDREIKALYGMIHRLHERGTTIIYISHRLNDIFNLCDRITVLRDGRLIDTVRTADIDKNQLIKMMVGREITQEYPREDHTVGETVLKVSSLTNNKIKDISFEVKQGEVFGISGLVGAGRTELIKAITGLDKVNSGTVLYNGENITGLKFRKIARKGIGLVPEDRLSQGYIKHLSVKENIILGNYDKAERFGLLQKRIIDSIATKYVDELSIAPGQIDRDVYSLSGGNQQKVVIAKWLLKGSELLILDEPTRGVDVGAKTEIYELINRMVREGKTVIMVSSEMPELIGMCDRIMVMHDGHKMGELVGRKATQEQIMTMCVI